jgi:ABC-type glycerol-3-phosphate transport system permease component
MPTGIGADSGGLPASLQRQRSGGGHILPLGLANLAIISQYRTDYGMLFAGLVLVTLPILIVYLALQKHLVKGITVGALKG